LILLPGIGEDGAGNVMKRVHKGFEVAVIDLENSIFPFGVIPIDPGKVLPVILMISAQDFPFEKFNSRI
jgi:hypothetical protein